MLHVLFSRTVLRSDRLALLRQRLEVAACSNLLIQPAEFVQHVNVTERRLARGLCANLVRSSSRERARISVVEEAGLQPTVDVGQERVNVLALLCTIKDFVTVLLAVHIEVGLLLIVVPLLRLDNLVDLARLRAKLMQHCDATGIPEQRRIACLKSATHSVRDR